MREEVEMGLEEIPSLEVQDMEQVNAEVGSGTTELALGGHMTVVDRVQELAAPAFAGGLRRSKRLNAVVEGSGIPGDVDVLQKAMRKAAARNLDGTALELAIVSGTRGSRSCAPRASGISVTDSIPTINSLSNDRIVDCLSHLGVCLGDNANDITASIDVLRDMERAPRSNLSVSGGTESDMRSEAEEEGDDMSREDELAIRRADIGSEEDLGDDDLDTEFCALMDSGMASKLGRNGKRSSKKGRR